MAMMLSLAAAALLGSAAAPPYPSFKITDAEFDRVTSAEYRHCMDKSGGVTASMRDCSGAEFARLDRALNIAYREAMARLDGGGKVTLRDAERQWLKTRWKQCDHKAAEEGGTLA